MLKKTINKVNNYFLGQFLFDLFTFHEIYVCNSNIVNMVETFCVFFTYIKLLYVLLHTFILILKCGVEIS